MPEWENTLLQLSNTAVVLEKYGYQIQWLSSGCLGRQSKHLSMGAESWLARRSSVDWQRMNGCPRRRAKNRPDQVVMVEAWKVGQSPTSRKVQKPVHLIRRNISLSSLYLSPGIDRLSFKNPTSSVPSLEGLSSFTGFSIFQTTKTFLGEEALIDFLSLCPSLAQPDRHTHCSYLRPKHGREQNHSGRFIQQSSFNEQYHFFFTPIVFFFGRDPALS
jgi:hypothetical protein